MFCSDGRRWLLQPRILSLQLMEPAVCSFTHIALMTLSVRLVVSMTTSAGSLLPARVEATDQQVVVVFWDL